MYITAHRVRDSVGQQAIHSFRHRHDPERCPFPEDPLTVPEQAPGVLEEQRTVLPQGGNSVLSYLDIIAPEHISLAASRPSLQELGSSLPGRPLPVAVQLGQVTVVFWAAPHIASPVDEYRQLLDHALQMLPARG